MIIEFKYSVVQDLMYHILAHMKVNNVSDLYSETYIDCIDKIKSSKYDSLEVPVSHLSNYYNENFGRLAVINFIPFVCSSAQDLVGMLENGYGFTKADKEEFIFPLNCLLKKEFEFYEDYWNQLYNTTALCRKTFEKYVKNELSKYEVLFAYFNKIAVVGMSYSLTNNGRGYEETSSFNAVVPFPSNEGKYKNSFYQILHEYTHQFTDKLHGENITMDNGSHDMSEKAVILFDYYLIKKLYEEDTAPYLKWIASLSNLDSCDEELFLSLFKIDDDINIKLLELLEKIIKNY